MPQSYLLSSELVLIGPVLNRALDASLLNSLNLSSIPQIAIDGGGKFASQTSVWAGDGDSGAPTQNATIFKKTSLDKTDFRFCLEVIASGPWTKLHLLGLLGRRKDHELANLGEVAHLFNTRPQTEEVIFYDQDFKPRVHFFQAGTIAREIEGLFSVLVLEKSTVSISGQCEFPITETPFEVLTGLGVSNVGRGRVEIKAATPFMLILENEQQS